MEAQRLYNPQLPHENRLPPRATVIPALHKGVGYQNKEESELILDLNGPYAFCYREKDDQKDFYTLNYDDSQWDSLNVPSMWQYHGYSKPLYPNVEYPIPFMPPFVGNKNPVGYYRKRFCAHKGATKILYFGGVDSAFFVYLNGVYVGFSKGSRIPAEFDVSALVQEGENLLCVKVFTYCDGTYLENQDMLLASGIFRDVFLYTLSDFYLWDYCLRTEENRVLLDLQLKGQIPADAQIKVTAAGISQCHEAKEELNLSFTVTDPIPWNAELPHTYPLSIELCCGDRTVEIHSKSFGFADFRVEANQILLNGAPITLKGINRHEHDPKNGHAITVEQIRRELCLIKEHNINAIRCSHYPNNPAFYEICTELGIYVMNEADIETHGAYKCGDMGYFSKNPRWYPAFYDRVSRMYERDKNETCISIWTLGNENGDGENLERCFHYLKNQKVKKPVMHTGDYGRDPRISEFRAFGYFNMEALTSFPPEGRPVMMLEYGHAMGNSPGLMEDTWDYVYRNRHICGGYLWEFKCHGFYQEDEEGTPFYQYGGDFGDYNHWSNFSMDGYCLSDGTPKPSLRECKNVLAPTYVWQENETIYLMNTNDFRPLDYLKLRWELREDYTLLRKGELSLPALAPYASMPLSLDSAVAQPKAGAEYFLTLHFWDGQREVACKQVSLGIPLPKPAFAPEAEALRVEKEENRIRVFGEDFSLEFTDGLLSYVKKGQRVVLEEPMALNLYRAPTDNDGIVNWNERWIKEWHRHLYRQFEWHLLRTQVEETPKGLCIRALGKWAPISKFTGFDLEICYTVSKQGKIFLCFHGTPYGRFADCIPRIGVVFPLNQSAKTVLWYGRGEDECYCDRKEHCPVGLYRSTVDQMNFFYDVPQECGTRVDTRFVKAGGLGLVGSPCFSFSYHDFCLEDLIRARHRNELKKADKNFLYVDYAMRGLGSKSCGPDPEECYELRAHEFRFAFLLVPEATEEELLALSRMRFSQSTEKLGPTHRFDPKTDHVNVVECDRD